MKFERHNPCITKRGPVARIWVGELPALRFEPSDVLLWHTTGAGAIATPRQAAYERSRALGGSWRYGLLGVSFIPGDGDTLAVEVGLTCSRDDKPWPLAEPPTAFWGITRVGLPREFAQALLDGVQGSPTLAHFGPGTLHFDHAAYNNLGSVAIAFRHLAESVLRLLTLPSEHPTEDAVFSLIGSTF